MKHLEELYPETRIERKREELDRLATSYVEKLFGFLPCLDLANKAGMETANDILKLASQVSTVQHQISGQITAPLQGVPVEPLAELTEAQHNEMVALIKQYGVHVMKDESNDLIYITHSTIEGRAMALNEAEIYEIVTDIANRVNAG